MIGDDKGTTYTYKAGELVSKVYNPPEGRYPFNYIARYVRVKFRKYFDKNPVVRELLKAKQPNEIFKSDKLPKNYSVRVYALDGLFYAQTKEWVDKFLASRVIVKRESSSDYDRYDYHLVAIAEEPEWSRSNEGFQIIREYSVAT